MRNLPQAAKDALAADNVVIAALVNFRLSSPVLACTLQQITYNGDIYLPNTGLMNVPDIRQEFNLSASSITLKFADAGSQLEAEGVNNGYSDKQLDIHIAILDAETMQLLHVIPSVYRGYCEEMQPSENGDVSFVFKNHIQRLEKTVCRRTNDANQHRYYPYDDTFNQITESSEDWLL